MTPERFLENLDVFLARLQFGLKARIRFYERLASFLEDGIPLYNTLRGAALRYDERKDPRGAMIKNWLRVMESGGTLADALKGWVPAGELMLISSAEESGNLLAGIRQAIHISQAGQQMKSAVIAAIFMPALLMTVVSGMIAAFSLFMAPLMAKLLPPARWPGSGPFLYELSQFIVNYGIIVVALISVLAYVIVMSLSRWTGETRETFNSIPPWSIYKSYQGSSFLIALSSMMGAKIPLDDSLKRMRKSANPWLNYHLGIMVGRLRKGIGNGDALDTGLLDRETADDIKDYGKLKSFEESMYAIGNRAVKDGVDKVRAGALLANMILIILTALLIGWMYMTVFSVNTTISETAIRQAQRPR